MSNIKSIPEIRTKKKIVQKPINKGNPVTKKNNNIAINIIMYKKYLKLKGDPTLDPNNNDKCKCVDYKSNGSNIPYSELEITKCNKDVVFGSDFCLEHKNCGNFLKKFTTGYEPEYNPDSWSTPSIEGSHNCYAYFLDGQKQSIKTKCEEACHVHNQTGCPKKIPECQNMIPQPGDYYLLNKYGNLKKKDTDYTCPNMHNKIMADNPHIKPIGLLNKCPKNHFKGAMVVDFKKTFHFYRQNGDGTWSHKPGILPVTNLDSNGKKIYIPHFADRNYIKPNKNNHINYTDFCGYYCIPKNDYYGSNMV